MRWNESIDLVTAQMGKLASDFPIFIFLRSGLVSGMPCTKQLSTDGRRNITYDIILFGCSQFMGLQQRHQLTEAVQQPE